MVEHPALGYRNHESIALIAKAKTVMRHWRGGTGDRISRVITKLFLEGEVSTHKIIILQCISQTRIYCSKIPSSLGQITLDSQPTKGTTIIMPEQNNSNAASNLTQNSERGPLETDYQAMCEATKKDVEMAEYESISQDKESFSQSIPPAKPFWQTAQFFEAVVSVTFYVATTVFTASQPFTTYERSIPYQYLDNAGDYVVNQEYNQSKTGSTVSPTVICIGALVIQQILSFVRRNMIGKSFYDMHATLCIYMIALSLNRLATEFIKNYVGYLR